MNYRIKQYPEDKFIVQYRQNFWPFWSTHMQATGWYYAVFANLEEARDTVKRLQKEDACLAFKPVYHAPHSS